VGGEGVDSFTGGIGFDVVDLSRETGTNNGDFNIFFDVTTGQNFGDLRDTFGNVEQFTAIDHFIGGNGSFDDFAGSDADETFTGGAGSSADDINGGGGIDTIDYSPETGGGNVTIDLTTAGTIGNTNAIDTFGHADAVRNIENVIGASGDDVIIGSALENMLAGVDGNDTLTGGDGDDTLIGGEGEDSANYSVENGGAGITARLRFDTVTDTFGATDTLNGIEQIIGTALADTMIGHDKDDNFVGGEGADYLDGAAGNDTIDGGLGADTILGFDGNDDLSGGAAAFNPPLAVMQAATPLRALKAQEGPDSTINSLGTKTTTSCLVVLVLTSYSVTAAGTSFTAKTAMTSYAWVTLGQTP